MHGITLLPGYGKQGRRPQARLGGLEPRVLPARCQQPPAAPTNQAALQRVRAALQREESDMTAPVAASRSGWAAPSDPAMSWSFRVTCPIGSAASTPTFGTWSSDRTPKGFRRSG